MSEPGPPLTAGGAMLEVLRRQGVRTVFCLAGAAHAPLLRDLETADFHIVSSRNESATVAAADGYARVTGRVGICMIAGYQGLPNALGGVRTAQLACSPVVLLASVSEGNAESMGEETNDGLDMVKPFVKWARSVPDAERVEEFFEAAIHAAKAGRPGVAVLGIPTHYEAARLRATRRFICAKVSPSAPAPGTEAVQAAIELLRRAQRPLILAGSGAALAGAGHALRTLAQHLGAPVFGHALGRGLVAEDLVHGYPWALAQVAARHADVVIAAGIRLQQRIGYGMAPRFADSARFIQIDIHPEELGRNRAIDVPLHADVRRSLEALLAGFESDLPTPRATSWVNEALAPRLARLEELGKDEAAPIHPLRIGRELMRLMPPETIFVADGADVYNWMSGIVRIRAERAYLDHYPLGSMGIGTPLALGAAAGARELAEDGGTAARPVVLVTGDGSFGFYPAELNSFALAGLKLVCVISNDGNWGTERNALKLKLGTTVNTVLGQCDYHLIGHAFGVRGERVETAAALRDALLRAFTAPQTTVLNVITDPSAGEARKQDKRLQMVTFEDLKSSLEAHHVMDLG